jgi:hypothetical protein
MLESWRSLEKTFGNAFALAFFCCTDTNEKQAGELACKVLGWNGMGGSFVSALGDAKRQTCPFLTACDRLLLCEIRRHLHSCYDIDCCSLTTVHFL